jgi:hypothetical protein
VASILAAQYKIMVEESMLIRAIKTNQLDFLYYVFATNKNYELVTEESSDAGSANLQNRQNDSDAGSEEGARYKSFTYDSLLTLISNYCENEREVRHRVGTIASTWKLKSNENFLQQMLVHRHDKIAADVGKSYAECATLDLLRFAVENSNVIFIKHALRKKLFDLLLLNEQDMIHFLLANLGKGRQSELLLNILTFADFRRWTNQKHLRELISIAQDIIDPGKEQNMMYVCYNPILAICLFSELLQRIGQAVSLFHHTCSGTSHSL